MSNSFRSVNLLRRAGFQAGLVLLAVATSGCFGKPQEDEQANLMKEGLDARYSRHDAGTAEARFRAVLQRNPSHYGATFQLARALDEEGRVLEARLLWEKMSSMAVATRDPATLTLVQQRLAREEATDPELLMKSGMHDLYALHRPVDAIEKFRKVLSGNPSHYGATYQLAVALDSSGSRDAALPLWQKVLKMAEGYHDTDTANTARGKIAAGG
jgi:thioredoxin-like negative regulator of GroEL